MLPPDIERLFGTKVQIGSTPESCPDLGPCLLWTAAKNDCGYPVVRLGGRNQYAHRIAFQMARGSIPEGFKLDHLCRVANCINPQHLEAVTKRENLMRSTCVSAKNAAKLCCPKGHSLTGENLIPWFLERGKHVCRTCKNERERLRYEVQTNNSVSLTPIKQEQLPVRNLEAVENI